MDNSIYPPWASELRNQYLSGESSLFLLHGNVRDLQRWVEPDGTESFISIRDFLAKFLFSRKQLVVYHNINEGITCPTQQQEYAFKGQLNALCKKHNVELSKPLPTDINEVIQAMRMTVNATNLTTAVVMDYFEMMAPHKELGFTTQEDKANLVSLQQWSSDTVFLQTDNIVIIIAQNLHEVAERFVSSPQLATIQLGLPSEEEREAFVNSQNLDQVDLGLSPEVLGKVTAGLSLLQIDSLFKGSRRSGITLDFMTVARRKKRIIERECNGLVEFVAPRFNFSHVGGMTSIKNNLMQVAKAVKAGRKNQVPMGMIFVGPMGTGKTFVAQAFAAESGLTCLKLKNVRGQYVGNTERNLDKVLSLVDALGYVLLVIDEADRALSTGSGSSEVDSRLIARLKEFMSDTSHRGRVVILMMTNRPDKIDIDLKRPGRFDLKIPFFFPEELTERVSILQALVRKNELPIEQGIDWNFAATSTEGYSGAELEAVLLNANRMAAEAGVDLITQEHIDQSAQEVVPSRDTIMLQYMETLAVFESSSTAMLPERYANLSAEEIQSQLKMIKSMLGNRV